MSRIIELKDRYKGYTEDQDKLIPPEKTTAMLKEKLRTLDYDILSYTQRIDNGRIGIPVFLVTVFWIVKPYSSRLNNSKPLNFRKASSIL